MEVEVEVEVEVGVGVEVGARYQPCETRARVSRTRTAGRAYYPALLASHPA